MTKRFLRLALLFLAPIVAACATDASLRPAIAPVDDPRLAVAAYDDPEVEAWFREPRPDVANQIVAGDTVRIRATLEGTSSLVLASVDLRVPPNGVLELPRTERTLVALKKTSQELEKEIAALYSEDYDPPYVLVAIVESAPRHIFITGEVRVASRYDLGPAGQLTLLQALTLAGGPSDFADMSRVRVQRFFPLREEVVSSPPLDVQNVIDTGDQFDNLVLEPGDTIVIPKKAPLQIYIMGHVARVGPIPWYRGLTLVHALAEAGGFKRFAKVTKITIQRIGVPEPILFDYDEFLEGNIPDLPLEPGDRIFVPEKWI